MKERPIIFSGPMVRAILEGRKTQTRRIRKIGTGLCPHGQPGDLLWVRETWGAIHRGDSSPIRGQPFDAEIVYRVDGDPDLPDASLWESFKWHPSIHMPKKYARLWLRITNARVGRVQEISKEDAEAEGVYQYWANCCDTDKWPQGWPEDAYNPEIGALSSTEVFHLLWDSLNAKRGYPWMNNDWVWVVEFEQYDHR